MNANLYNDTMLYNAKNGAPWHRQGVSVNGLATSEQAIESAQLDYDVIKEQLFRQDSSIAKGAFATINTANDKVLGVVGARYEIIQNRNAFIFFDELVGKGEAVYETAGALGDGEKIWLLAKLPKSFEPISGDKIEEYCLLSNSHNGSTPCQVSFVNIRVVCQNTFNLALKNATQIIKIRHTIKAEDRLEEAGHIIKEMNEYFTIMGEKCYELGQFQIDDNFINMYKDALFGIEKDIPEGRGRTLRTKKIESFDNYMKTGKGIEIPGVVGTAWWPVQAAIEYSNWLLPKPGRESESIFFGNALDFSQKAWDKAIAMVNARSKSNTNISTLIM